jgi:hypothetical protein
VSLDEFNLLPYERQLAIVFDEGSFLARRWEEEDGVNLYHLPGDFFVEFYYNTHANKLVRLRSFKDATLLEDYVAGIRLPEL